MHPEDRRCLYTLLPATGAAAVLAVVLLLLQYHHPPPRYYACIVSISRIDSTTLEFNVSLSVECRKPMWGRTCLELGTGVAVAYHGLPIAFAATGAEVCSGWYKLVWCDGAQRISFNSVLNEMDATLPDK